MRGHRGLAWVLVGALALVGVSDSPGSAGDDDDMMELYGLFVDAVERVESNYVLPVDRKELLENALRGMLAELDPYSSYLSEAEWSQFRKQIEGSFTGIGISVEIDPRSRQLRVLAPLPGSPAYTAGILPGDQILEVDGKPTDGLTRDQSIEALQGRPGTQVTLKVKHEKTDEPEMLTITRAIIELPSVVGDTRKPDDTWDYMLDKTRKIGYIRITNFVENTSEELQAALEELKNDGVKGLILDLRDNPGGLLSAAVDVSDLFLTDGTIVSTKGRNQKDKSYEAEAEGTYADIPMAILINQNSASASEIVSAALQDQKRATIIGQRSWGKGSVQNILPLNDGESILKLTVATYLRPSGVNIHRFPNDPESKPWGVSPDPDDTLKLSEDEYRAWARARRQRDMFSRLNPAAPAPEEDGKAHPGIDDTVLDKAIDTVAEEITRAALKGAKNAAE